MLSKKFGAGNETRTRDLYLGKVSLYQLSYSRKKRSPHYMDGKLYVKKIDTILCKTSELLPYLTPNLASLYNLRLLDFEQFSTTLPGW